MESYLVWGLGLLAVALILVIVDVFLPTFGILSITSLVVGIAGVICLFNYSTAWGLVGSLLVVVGGPSVLFFGLQVMPSTPIGRKLVLGSEDPSSADEREAAKRAGTDETAELAKLIGADGVVTTDLRPVGTVRIGDQRYDALSEMSMVRSGTQVRVVGTDGMTLKVRPVA